MKYHYQIDFSFEIQFWYILNRYFIKHAEQWLEQSDSFTWIKKLAKTEKHINGTSQAQAPQVTSSCTSQTAAWTFIKEMYDLIYITVSICSWNSHTIHFQDWIYKEAHFDLEVMFLFSNNRLPIKMKYKVKRRLKYCSRFNRLKLNIPNTVLWIFYKILLAKYSENLTNNAINEYKEYQMSDFKDENKGQLLENSNLWLLRQYLVT